METFFSKILGRTIREGLSVKRLLASRKTAASKRWWRFFVGTVIILLVSGGIHNFMGRLISLIAIIALFIQVALFVWRRYNSLANWRSGKQAKSTTVAVTDAPGAHDICFVYQLVSSSLHPRGFMVGMPISIGRNLGISGARFWSPHALVLGATGSGKTSLLRPLIGRWMCEGPVCGMSTKGDLIPESLPGVPGTVHLVTPKGREYLDSDGQARLDSLEAAGWSIIDARWDPVTWVAEAPDEVELEERASALATCLAEVVTGGDSSHGMWSTSARHMIRNAIIIECATIKTGLPNWRALIDPSAGGKTGSDILLDLSSSGFEPGIERMVQEIQLEDMTSYPSNMEISPTLSPVERAAAKRLLSMGGLLKGNNATASSTHQTATTALGAYELAAARQSRQPVDIPNWANSDHDLLLVVVPSDQSSAWAAPMAALAVAVWTEASGTANSDHLIVLDEVASLAPVPQLGKWVAQGRSLGVHVVAVLQSESQAKVWAGNDTTGWVLDWPLVLVASGTPSYGLAKHLADGEGQWEVEKISENETPPETWFGEGKKSTSRSKEMRDRIEPNDVFSHAVLGAWRVVDRRVGPWATPWRT